MESHFPGSKLTKINGKTINPKLTVADLVDDLDAIYKVDNSKAAVAQRKQWKQNQLYVDKLLKQKHLT